MATVDELLEACRLAPDDDAPRLVWADAVGGERGELVVIQCDLARGGLSPAEAGARRRRERELLQWRGQEWAEGLGDLHLRDGEKRVVEFRRGFVEAIQIEARVFANHGEEIVRRAPLLRSLTAIGLDFDRPIALNGANDPIDELRRLYRSPAFSRLRCLEIGCIGNLTEPSPAGMFFDGRGDEVVDDLVESGVLAQLVAFGISNIPESEIGTTALVASGALGHLEKLWLRAPWRWDYMTPPGLEFRLPGTEVAALLGTATRLKSLDLSGATGLEAFIPALPPVTQLFLSGITDETLALLGQSRAATTIEELWLLSGELEHLDALRAFPRLRMLDLNGTSLQNPERSMGVFTALVPGLRLLQLPILPEATLGSTLCFIARELGPYLEGFSYGGAARLGLYNLLEDQRAYIAGEYGPSRIVSQGLL